MKASYRALLMIKQFEGLRLTPYKCTPNEKYYTIGYGHYGIKTFARITEEHAEDFLLKDVKRCEREVNKYHKKYLFNQNEYDALISFTFNIGSIKQLTDGGHRTKEEISKAIPMYVKSGDVLLQGLVMRRRAEQTLFNKECA